MMKRLYVLLPGLAMAISLHGDIETSKPSKFTGMCDASAGVAIATNLFIAANDEDNDLRLFRNDQEGAPIKTFNFSRFLGLDPKASEMDLEAAARMGDRAYWLSSLGRNRRGKFRVNRQFFFATDIKASERGVNLDPVGKPYKNLLEDLVKDPRFIQFKLDRAAMLAPKDRGGLNIEGLSAMPDKHLLLGFRNPIPYGKALLIPLLNPEDVIAGVRAKFGDAIRLDLGGKGVRDIVYAGGKYFIIAGAFDGGGRTHLWEWAGGAAQARRLEVDHFKKYNAEALIIYPDKGLKQIQILSDDGTRTMKGIPCKELRNPAAKSFRSFWVYPESVNQ